MEPVHPTPDLIRSDRPDRQSEADWLQAAYELLTEAGVDAVKIMPLAKRLGVSRTSFYWHFKDRDALLEAMVKRWEQKNTGNLIARTEAYAESIAEAVFNLFDCWIDDDLFDAPLDLAIRNWARNDADLGQRVDQADSCRKEALKAMFLRFGFDATQSEVRALTVLYAQVGYISMQIEEDREGRIARMPDYIEAYCGQRPTERECRRFQARHP
ncbi:TetR/AcrR family transcriptional regulator [Thalassobius sp. Cn5-15]|uniref:TetR/AcrR family transcriptional regulator n=1 Tax=Thalassobius sp. Cn5-15 TaxID=2917763 RepID=UPI001EF3A756|nr:TetR/AcrR family transcriptional regulator [Thalassobius sp. Cn5-15]MCG7492175.1 TetR/AcrR family transcriptional regulator [Thalassobius sp. Cn5-15]